MNKLEKIGFTCMKYIVGLMRKRLYDFVFNHQSVFSLILAYHVLRNTLTAGYMCPVKYRRLNIYMYIYIYIYIHIYIYTD